jgi:hypothetical protein
MENNLDAVAKDLYGKIKTRFPDIKIGDENAEVLSKKSDIPKARFFEFEYEEHGEPLGIIVITLDEDDGVVVQVSGDLSNDTSSSNHDAYRFIRSFRKFAKSRLLNFDVQNIGKSNLDKRDYLFQAKSKESVMENKMFGTKKISYQDLGEARLIVKHSQPINPELAAGRSMHIGSIYVENADGERFKYPYKHLHGARALAEHIKHGGNPYDAIGKYITGLSEEMAQLRKFKGVVSRQSQLSEAIGGITDKVVERISEVKKEIQRLQRASYYEQFAESFQAPTKNEMPEQVMDEWIERLTVKTFNEDLKSVLPYLYNIVGEGELPVKELGIDDLLGESEFGQKGLIKRLGKQGIDLDKKEKDWEDTIAKQKERHSKADTEMEKRNKEWKEKFGKKDESLNPEATLTNFFEEMLPEFDITDGGSKNLIFSPIDNTREAALKKFNELSQNELVGGDAGVLAVKGLLDNPEITNAIRMLNDDGEIRGAITQYIISVFGDERATEAKSLIKDMGLENDNPTPIGGETPVEPAPTPEPTPAPAPEVPPTGEQPPAGEVPPMGEPTHPTGMPPAGASVPPPGTQPPLQESVDGKIKLKAKFIKAKMEGATLDMPFAEGMTLGDAMRECGIDPTECGYDSDSEPDADTKQAPTHAKPNPKDSGVSQLLKLISGFWNKAEKNFTIGGTRAKIKVLKAFKNNECPNANEEDVKKVFRFIDSKDPSEDVSDEQRDVIRLSGVVQPNDTDNGSDMVDKIKGLFMKEQPVMESELSQIMKNAGLK